MPTEMNTKTPSATPADYTIVVKGRLDPYWSDWFGGLMITPAGVQDDETLLFGPVADQAALHGILNQIGSLGLTLISVICLDTHAEPPSAKEPGNPNPGESDLATREERI